MLAPYHQIASVTLALLPRLVVHDAWPLGALASSWLAALATSGRAVETIRAYRRDLRHFLEWAWQSGLRSWSDVHGAQVLEWLENQRETGVSDSLVSRRIAALPTLIRFGRDQGFALDELRIARPRIPRPVAQVIGQATFDRVLAATKPSDYFGLRDRALLCVLWYCGPTARETSSLDVTGLDLREATLAVHGSLRRIPIAPYAVEALRAWLFVRRPVGDPGHREALFLTARGLRLSPAGVQRTVSTRSICAGVVPPISPRILRSSFAVRLLEGGMDEPYVAALLGHVSIGSTLAMRRACNPHRGKAAQAIAALERARGP